MSKELEALEDIILYLNASEPKGLYCENIETIQQALQRLEAIENVKPSEALECLKKLNGMEISSMPFKDDYGIEEVDLNDIRKVGSQLNTDFREYIDTIKRYILKEQEQKKYLNWEDLEFEDFPKEIEVRIGYNICKLEYRVSMLGNKTVILRCNNKIYLQLFENGKQFFNDLHLEVLE